MSAAGWASIGSSGRPGCSRSSSSPRPARSQRDRRHRAEVAAQHQRAAHRADRHPRGPRHRIRHHPGQRALAQLARQQRHQEAALVRAGAREQFAEQPPPRALRARPRARPDPLEGRVDLAHGQRRRGPAGRQIAQRGPADADLALAQLARQPGHRGGHLRNLQTAQDGGQYLDLGAARRRGPDRLRRLDQVAQQHGCILPDHGRATRARAQSRNEPQHTRGRTFCTLSRSSVRLFSCARPLSAVCRAMALSRRAPRPLLKQRFRV